MPAFKYRLATLLKLREGARDERRAQLAEAYLAEQKLHERRGELRQELAQCEELQRRGAAGALDVDRLLDTHRYQLVLKAELAVIERQNEVLAAEIEKRRQALVAADREVRVLEKLRETQYGRFLQQQSLLEMKQLDEVASRTSPAEETG